MFAVARHAASGRRRTLFISLGVLVVAVAAVGVAVTQHGSTTSEAVPHLRNVGAHRASAPTPSAPTTTTTSTLPPPGPGFVTGQVTAVGDSVMLDYQQPLETDVPGINVLAAVSRQWDTGAALLQQLKDEDQLGAQVVVALSTNGPITPSDFADMMSVLQGASRIVFVNIHVDRPWQDPNNAVLAQGAAENSHVVIADWATLAAQNPSWFGPDGTHLAIDGPGATALAALIASKLSIG